LKALAALRAWSGAGEALAELCQKAASLSPLGAAVTLPGPTGERNSYAVLPRERVLCLAATERDLLSQLALLLAMGAQAVWPATGMPADLRARLPEAVREAIVPVRDWLSRDARFDAVLHHGSREERLRTARQLAERDGPIASLHAFDPGEDPLAIERLLVERVVSVNTAAAGGNASLMTVG
jgi:RHH-type proline utilization regulon transcriptional repressor/proline dehydrogenase/delta 1-pyrroline-5-carboxylate dehydrogenase